MLDKFLEVACSADQQRGARNDMAEGFMQLPVEELQKIASGEVKLAYYDDDHWLCKFKETEFYDDALGIETQMLELDAKMQEIQLADSEERTERSDMRSEIYSAQDGLRLKRKLLELELRKAELAAMGGGDVAPEEGAEAAASFDPEAEESPEEEAAEEAEAVEAEPEAEAAPPDPEKMASAMFFARANAVMAKFAAEKSEKKGKPKFDPGAHLNDVEKQLDLEEAAANAAPAANVGRTGPPQGMDPMSQAILQRAQAAENMSPHGKPLALGGMGGTLLGAGGGAALGALGSSALGLKGNTAGALVGAGAGLGGGLGAVGGGLLAEKAFGNRSARIASEKAYGEADQRVKSLRKSAGALDSLQKRVYDSAAKVESKMDSAKSYIQDKADTEKKAEAAISVADQWGRELARMQKEAGLGQIGSMAMQGLKGAGKALGQAGGVAKKTYQRGALGGGVGGGLKAVADKAAPMAKGLIGRGANWANQTGTHRLAAGAIGAGALGATALGAGALGAGGGALAAR